MIQYPLNLFWQILIIQGQSTDVIFILRSALGKRNIYLFTYHGPILACFVDIYTKRSVEFLRFFLDKNQRQKTYFECLLKAQINFMKITLNHPEEHFEAGHGNWFWHLQGLPLRQFNHPISNFFFVSSLRLFQKNI